MINFFKLIRIQNLLIIALTQYMFRYFIMIPVMEQTQHVLPAMSHLNYAMLVFSTMLVAAAGYVINDYFDIKADMVNKPKKVLVGRGVSRKQAVRYYMVMNILSVMLGFYVSYKVGSIKLGAINIVISVLLWFYSAKYKAYFLVGNLIVALLSGLVIVVAWLYEMAALVNQGDIFVATRGYKYVCMFMLGYFAFATIVSLVREIIKDIEDVEGDKKMGCSTMPIVIGIRKTQFVITGLNVVALCGLAYVSYVFKSNIILFWYFIFAICLPMLYLAYVSFVAKTKSDFTLLSNVAKYCMVAGVMSMLVFFIN